MDYSILFKYPKRLFIFTFLTFFFIFLKIHNKALQAPGRAISVAVARLKVMIGL